ncbi:MAG TPA: SDR family oxidoreductase [Bacteroidetes bacterium]|nr:SDR family oxidoreductase [Bacteroidota bacterium]
MKLLITGACGYIGSQFLKSLDNLREVYEIKILDNFSSGSKKALLDLPLKHSYQLVEGDILDLSAVAIAMQGVDIVVHLAALVSTPLSFGNLHLSKQVNHWGTNNLLESALKNDVKHFVFVSSTAVYGPTEEECSDTFKPFGSYATSKYDAEKSIESYRYRGLPVTILRMGSVYGIAPITRFDSVVNRFLHQAATNSTITIYGDGSQKRPILHVKDAANAILFVLSKREKVINKSFNVLEENLSIQKLAEYISSSVLGLRIRYVDQDARTRYSFEINKDLLNEIGWANRFKLSIEFKKDLSHYPSFERIGYSDIELE